MKNKEESNNITERIGIVVIIILILLLSFRRKLFFKNEDNITIVEPDKNLLELTASETTDGLNGNSTQIISLTQQITNLTEYITYLTNQINESNGDNSVLEAEVAALQSQLNICQGSCFDIELTIIKQPSSEQTPNGCIGLKVKNGNAPFSYQWKKDGVNQHTTKNIGFTYGSGLWSCTVTDSENVSITKQIQLDALAINGLSVASYSKVLPSSDVSSDGEYGINISGGLPPYKYRHNTGQSINPITGLGNFTSITAVSDSVGNSLWLSGTLFSPINSLFATPLFTVFSFNGTLIHNVEIETYLQIVIRPKAGETYTYLWSNGNTTSAMNSPSPGTYSVVITGSLGSSTINGIIVPIRAKAMINISTLNSSGGGSNGSLVVSSLENILGTNFTFHLYNETIEEYFTNTAALKAGNYTITVFSENAEKIIRSGVTIL